MTIVEMPARSSIFDSSAEALVNPVNCVGVMGKGLALEFKRRFPDMYDDYAKMCATHGIWSGRCHLHHGRWLGGILHNRRPLRIISFPTKYHWTDRSTMATVRDGMGSLVGLVAEHGIGSVAIPALGCGLGGLQWADVRPVIVDAAGTMPEVRWEIYGPKEGSQC